MAVESRFSRVGLMCTPYVRTGLHRRLNFRVHIHSRPAPLPPPPPIGGTVGGTAYAPKWKLGCGAPSTRHDVRSSAIGFTMFTGAAEIHFAEP